MEQLWTTLHVLVVLLIVVLVVNNLILSCVLCCRRESRQTPTAAASPASGREREVNAVFFTPHGRKFHNSNCCHSLLRAKDGGKERVQVLLPSASCLGRCGSATAAPARDPSRMEAFGSEAS